MPLSLQDPKLESSEGKGYTLFAPMGGDIAFDVDVSQVRLEPVKP